MNEPLRRGRSLRINQTEAERFLWAALRNRRFHEFKFRRQVPLGRYIVDFVCFAPRLILELDGGQHNDAKAKAYDAERTRFLESEGFRVVRVWNHEVFVDSDAVAELIWRRLHEAAESKGDLPLTPSMSHPKSSVSAAEFGGGGLGPWFGSTFYPCSEPCGSYT